MSVLERARAEGEWSTLRIDGNEEMDGGNTEGELSEARDGEREERRQREVRGRGPEPMNAILEGGVGEMECIVESSRRVRSI